MYTKDKSVRITIRLNEAQNDFVKACAEVLGVTPSDYVRSVLNVFMSNAYSSDNQKEGN